MRHLFATTSLVSSFSAGLGLGSGLPGAVLIAGGIAIIAYRCYAEQCYAYAHLRLYR